MVGLEFDSAKKVAVAHVVIKRAGIIFALLARENVLRSEGAGV